MKEVYIIKVFSKIFSEWRVFGECYTTEEKAIKEIESRLNEEEIEKNRNAKKRNLQFDYEFSSKNYIYEIKKLIVK